ncbi:MAG: cellulase family glycosylhydrolase [Verrucomicrobiia bacterium]
MLVLFFATGNAQPAGNGLLTSTTVSFDSKLDFMQLHTGGTKVFDARGKPVWLYGVNIASLEWTNDGDHVQLSVNRAIHDWHVNLIRLPLAQDRWFGKMPGQADGGAAYRAIVDRIVETCAAAQVYVDLDLHWSDCGKWADEGGQLGQHVMPDNNSVAFWHDTATRYRNHPNVIFGLYNEPHDTPWDVWRNGGTVPDVPAKEHPGQTRVTFDAAGLQTLYDTVRAAGAQNLVTVSGLNWGYDLSGVLRGYAIAGTNFVYETHPYPVKKDWDQNFGEVSGKYPVYVGEWGFGGSQLEGTNALAYGERLLSYIKDHDIRMWTAWDLHPAAGPSLIKNWSYEPTAFGKFVKKQLAAEAAAHGPMP